VRYKVNTPPVIHQTLEGEVIAVNLETGTYYSMVGSGAEIWSAIEHGVSIDETVQTMLERYDASRTVVEPAVVEFVEALVAEELLLEAEGGMSSAAAPNGAAASAPNGPFVAPALERYTDLQELLVLDPIHEVDEQGWPSAFGAPPAGE
jgi:Coenzyme PQQ synthesis protein D (PqqD)